MPKRGIWQQTRKMKRVTAVHSTFSLNWICGREEGRGGWGEVRLNRAPDDMEVPEKHKLHTTQTEGEYIDTLRDAESSLIDCFTIQEQNKTLMPNTLSSLECHQGRHTTLAGSGNVCKQSHPN